MEKDLLGAIKYLKTDFPSAIWNDKIWPTVYGPDDWSQVRLEMGGYLRLRNYSEQEGLVAIIIWAIIIVGNQVVWPVPVPESLKLYSDNYYWFYSSWLV